MTRKSYRNRTCRRFFLFYALFVLSLVVSASSLQAQTIHVLIAADTKVDRAGPAVAKSVQIDREKLERLFRENVPETQLSIHTLPENKIWAADILEAVDKTEIGPDDTFIFIYTGHGAYDNKKMQQFFQLSADQRGKPYPGQNDLFRNDVLERMKRKQARLTVMITDCCNIRSEAKVDPTRETVAFYRHAKPTRISPAFESLFIFRKGLADITSSKIGEASGIDTNNWKGSCFTYPLVDLLTVNRDDELYDWKTLMDELTPKVQTAFAEAYPKGANGQFRQTVYAYSYPGMSEEGFAAPAEVPAVSQSSALRQGPRFGIRAVANTGGGIRVTEIIKDSPGEKAGFENGDIIFEINDKPINNEQEYSDAVDASPKEMRLKLKNSRDGQIITPTIELGW